MPAGPWLSEPDVSSYVDATTGLPVYCFRHPYDGYWCAYIGVPLDDERIWKELLDVDVVLASNGHMWLGWAFDATAPFKDPMVGTYVPLSRVRERMRDSCLRVQRILDGH